MQETFITIQNIKTRIKQHGAGQPVLFVHGNPDSADMWDDVISRLPDSGYHYLAIDLAGFGKADPDDTFDYSIQNRGEYLADALDALALDVPVLVVGHDHGGPFAASFAVQYPERVKGLVLQNTLFHSDYVWHPFGKAWRTPLLGEYLNWTVQFKFISVPILYRYMKWGEPLVTLEYAREVQARFSPKMSNAILRIYRASHPEAFVDWEDRLNEFMSQKPSLVLWGVHDSFLPIKFAKRWEQNGAKLITYDDAGHWLAINKPAEYAHELTTFFTELE